LHGSVYSEVDSLFACWGGPPIAFLLVYIVDIEAVLPLGDQLVAEDPVDVVGPVEVVRPAQPINPLADLAKVGRAHLNRVNVDAAGEMVIEPADLAADGLVIAPIHPDQVEQDQRLGGLLLRLSGKHGPPAWSVGFGEVHDILTQRRDVLGEQSEALGDRVQPLGLGELHQALQSTGLHAADATAARSAGGTSVPARKRQPAAGLCGRNQPARYAGSPARRTW
jgi:hypothetical protein